MQANLSKFGSFMKRLPAIAALIVLTAVSARAQFPMFGWPDVTPDTGSHKSESKVLQFDYDVDFTYKFDNREYGDGANSHAGGLEESMTVNAIRLTPWAGFSIVQSETLRHRLMVGVDFVHDMGETSLTVGTEGSESGKLSDFREFMAYYRADAALRRGQFTAIAGIYPLEELDGDWSKAYFSDYSRFYDAYMEGMLFRFRGARLKSCLALDWTGMYGDLRREQFRIYSSGEQALGGIFSAGWTLEVGHFASAREIEGMTDDILATPYAKADLASLTGWFDELSVREGAMLSYQRDRKTDSQARFPTGSETVLTARWHSLGISDTFYAGDDLMPYYDATFTSSDGRVWTNGASLYRGLGFYRTGKWYNRVEASWRPRISDFLSVEVAVDLHFAGGIGMAGWQQKATLILDLDALRHPGGVTYRKIRKHSPARPGENIAL